VQPIVAAVVGEEPAPSEPDASVPAAVAAWSDVGDLFD
jgi:hypothetical protein